MNDPKIEFLVINFLFLAFWGVIFNHFGSKKYLNFFKVADLFTKYLGIVCNLQRPKFWLFSALKLSFGVPRMPDNATNSKDFDHKAGILLKYRAFRQRIMKKQIYQFLKYKIKIYYDTFFRFWTLTMVSDRAKIRVVPSRTRLSDRPRRSLYSWRLYSWRSLDAWRS